MHRLNLCARILLVLMIPTLSASAADSPKTSAVRVGWIGAMTGPIAKYGADQAARLAQEDINAAGGINGRPLELIFEDGRGDSKTAVNAANKLLSVDRVKLIIGGHCTPESLPISSIAERNKAVMLAAITSSPKLTTAGDYVFRVTAVSTKGVDLQVAYARNVLNLKRMASIVAETDYAKPLADHLAEVFPKAGGEIVASDSYLPAEVDFRAMLTKIKSRRPDGIYIGVQSPDTAALILQQMKDLGMKAVVFGNELTGTSFYSDPKKAELFEGLIFPEPKIDWNSPAAVDFVERFKKRFKVDSLPFGFWTAEAYDAVRLMAKAIAECGEDPEKVKTCLYKVKDYPGISGSIGIDANGDGIRTYLLKVVKKGEISPVS